MRQRQTPKPSRPKLHSFGPIADEKLVLERRRRIARAQEEMKIHKKMNKNSFQKDKNEKKNKNKQ